MTPQAAAKVDPRLLLIHKDPGLFAKKVGKTVNIQGSSLDEAILPVLIKTTALTSLLEDAGAVVGSRHGDIVAARIPLARLEQVALISEVEAIEASYKLHNMMDVSVPECGGTAVHNGSPSYDGEGVVVGLLDTGIDPYHADFEDAGGNARVQYIWDQWGSGSAPSGYGYGTEWTKTQIDNNQCTMTDPGAHGSHCAGTAAGDGSASGAGYIGMAPKADIIMVSNLSDDLFYYGYAPPWYQSPSTMGALDGLAYMKSKANSLGKPLVVSWSQGVTMGPHDGSTLFEQGVDNFVTSSNVPVVVAAGNDQQSDWHGKGTVTTGNALVAGFTTGIPGQDQLTGSVVFEVWYEQGDLMGVEIMDPNGTVTNVFGPNENWAGYTMSQGDTVWVWSASNHPVSHKGYFLIYIDNRNLGVLQGNWAIGVSAQNGLPQGGNVDMWFERNQYSVRWLDHVSYESIVGMPGSADKVITVGSYNTKVLWYDIDGNGWQVGEPEGDISDFSSNGPTADGRQKPTLSAPGQIIASVMSSGAAPGYMQDQRHYVAPDGFHVYMQGTSMATPHVAGAVALMLEKDPSLTYSQIRQILTDTARHDSFTGQGWSKAFGWGKLDALAAVQAVGGGGEPDIPLEEGFDTSPFPPTGWTTTVTSSNYTWQQGNPSNHPFSEIDPSSQNSALCPWVAENQDEWLISPTFTISGSPATLEFYAGHSTLYLSYATLKLHISQNGGSTWTQLWEAANDGGEWGWRQVQVDLSGYANRGNVKLAWQYVGNDGDLVALDGIVVEVETASGEDSPVLSTQLFLAQNHPNPFNSQTAIRFSVPENNSGSDVTLRIYNIEGRLVRTLLDRPAHSGIQDVLWNARDDNSKLVPAGAYFYQLRVDQRSRTKRMILYK